MVSDSRIEPKINNMYLELLCVFCLIYLRDAPRVKNPVGQVVMRGAAGRRRCPAAPSDLPKSGGAAAPAAPPLGASLG